VSTISVVVEFIVILGTTIFFLGGKGGVEVFGPAGGSWGLKFRPLLALLCFFRLLVIMMT
jgi:hypothetical protein